MQGSSRFLVGGLGNWLAGLKGVPTGTPLHRPSFEPQGGLQRVYSRTGSHTGMGKQTRFLASPRGNPRSCPSAVVAGWGKTKVPIKSLLWPAGPHKRRNN